MFQFRKAAIGIISLSLFSFGACGSSEPVVGLDDGQANALMAAQPATEQLPVTDMANEDASRMIAKQSPFNAWACNNADIFCNGDPQFQSDCNFWLLKCIYGDSSQVESAK